MLNAFCQPCHVGPLKLRSRWVMPPMSRGRCQDSRFVPENIDYYRKRAANGVGLIVTEGMVIDHPLATGPGTDQPRLHPDNRDGICAVTEAVHASGGCIAAQLWHQGHQIPGVGISAQETHKEGKLVGTEATETDRAAVIDAFARAAVLAKSCGFDAVELHGAHGYLLDSFLRRWGTWRGEPTGATRFVRDVVREVRHRVGPRYPVIFRISQWTVDAIDEPYMKNPADIAQVMLPLAEAGVDIFHVSTRRFWAPAFAGDPRTMSAWCREITGLPVIAVGGMGNNHKDGVDRFATYAHADRLLAVGAFDLLAVGTALYFDPGWCDKARRQALFEMEIPKEPKD